MIAFVYFYYLRLIGLNFATLKKSLDLLDLKYLIYSIQGLLLTPPPMHLKTLFFS